MIDDKTTNRVVKNKGIEEIIYEVMKPNTPELAKTTGNLIKILNLVLYPFVEMADNKEKILEFLLSKIKKRFKNCPENISPPMSNIGWRILYDLSLEGDNRLKEMYANLLLNSMDKKFNEVIHKSFIYILENISPDEAKIIEYIANTFSDSFAKYEEINIFTTEHGEDSIEYEFSNFLKKIDIERPSYSDFYLENLTRLGILKSKLLVCDPILYPGGHNRYGDYEPSVTQESIDSLSFTSLGKKFVKSCTENH